MNYAQKIVLKVTSTLLASGIAFCLGTFVTGVIVEHYLLPRWIKQAPHDGQVGLAVFDYLLKGGLATALVVFFVGIIWTAKTSRREEEMKSQKVT